MKDKIKAIREMKNFTQDYMADQLGISQAAYSKIEKGNTDLSYKKMQKIAHVLGVSLESMINFDTQHYFSNSFNNINGSYNFCSNACGSDFNSTISSLYEDKIALLEKLLGKADQELKVYQDRYGVL